MGKSTGFKEYSRQLRKERPIGERIKDYKEIYESFSGNDIKLQAARCMNCGTPFCNWACPLGNLSPDFNNMVYNGHLRKAYKRLILTSIFPEFTGRLCPALCEGSCTLGVNRQPVSVRDIELYIIEKAYEKGWVTPHIPSIRTGKKVAIIGSGPSGLAAAAFLNMLGHFVTVFERSDEVGGLLRYGIPDFKLEKHIIDRRISLMEQEGIIFRTGEYIGKNRSIFDISDKYDALLLAGGSTVPRDLNIEGRELEGVYFAVDYLTQQNRKNAGKSIASNEISAKGKTVVIIGGGDTGSDCIGTAVRQGAKKVYQYEIMPKPPEVRDETMPWPDFPKTLKTTSSHEEGCIRKWCISAKKIIGEGGKVKSVISKDVSWEKDANGMTMKEIQGSEFEQQADMIILCMGFLHCEHESIADRLNLQFDAKGNIKTDENYMASIDGMFAAGDMRTGQSLVVRAISDGINAAKCIDKYLMK
ncbi:MAG TPA: glutamate synthase [Clostridiaceae bacterium]|nr:glutamate synthase [Clostridiaceae bacterium]